ncbi:MAG: amidohydrolase family protein [Lentisphaerota bacterium]
MKIIDFHTHAFPDKLAERAVPALAKEGKIEPALDGKISSLLRSMDLAGIDKSVICSIATRPEQYEKIFNWSRDIASDRIIPFLSVHPDDPGAVEQIRGIGRAGFKGVKLHPYYQAFYLDEPRMFPLYEAICEQGLIFVSHTGYDIAFPREPRCGPAQIVNVCNRFPELKFVATHFGAWEDWDEVEKHLIGKELYMDISFSLMFLDPVRICNYLAAHSDDHILFGTDSPWAGQKEEVDRVKALNIPEELKEKIFHLNAEKLLGLKT